MFLFQRRMAKPACRAARPERRTAKFAVRSHCRRGYRRQRIRWAGGLSGV